MAAKKESRSRKWSEGELKQQKMNLNGFTSSTWSETHTELKVATKAADILESDKSSEGDECTEEDESDGVRPAASTERRERKQPLDSSASSLDLSPEQSHLSGSESDNECNR